MRTFFVTIITALLLPTFAGAATITLSPSNLTLTAGRDYTVAVYVTPAAGEKIYTAKLTLSYPADIVSASGFSYAPSWLPLTQPGYDALGAGSVTKTAGYPGGLVNQTLLGTLSFRALSSGSGAFSVTSGAQTLDQNNANTLTNRGSASLTVSAPAAPPVDNPPRIPAAPIPTAPKPVIKKPPAKTPTALAPISSTAATSAPRTTEIAALPERAVEEVAASAAAAEGTIPVTLAFILGILAFLIGIGSGILLRR